MGTEMLITPNQKCPHCDCAGGCGYAEIPESCRSYVRDGEEFVEHFGITHEYICSNCGAEWAILNPEELAELAKET